MATASKQIELMKVTELREALEARGLDSAGLKAVLVARLQEAQQVAEVDKDEKVPTTNPSSDEDQPPAEEAEVEKNDEKESPPTANASSNEDEVEKDKKMTTANAQAEAEEAEPEAEEPEPEAGADEDEDGGEIPYMEPKPGGKAWRFVTNHDKKASPQVSAALTALVDKYGTLKAAVAAGWQFVEKDGTAVSVNKTSGPHHMVAPGGGPDDILTSGQALGAIASEPMPANAAKRARSK